MHATEKSGELELQSNRGSQADFSILELLSSSTGAERSGERAATIMYFVL